MFARRGVSIFTSDFDWGSHSLTTSCVWINVGGPDYHSQQRRLRAVAAVIAQQQ